MSIDSCHGTVCEFCGNHESTTVVAKGKPQSSDSLAPLIERQSLITPTAYLRAREWMIARQLEGGK